MIGEVERVGVVRGEPASSGGGVLGAAEAVPRGLSSVLALPKVEPARTRERDRVSVARATAKGKRWKRCRKQGGTGARAVGVSVQARDAMPVARGAGAAHLTPGATC